MSVNNMYQLAGGHPDAPRRWCPNSSIPHGCPVSTERLHASITLAKIFQDLSIEEFDLARGIQGTHKPRNGVDDQTKAFLTLPKRRLIALSVFDVGVRSEPFDNFSIVVKRRSRTEEKPAIHAIETA